jgi:imidazolonepropionase-like amidohydrolase
MLMTGLRTLLHSGQVFDGTGSPPAAADVVIEGDRIIDVGPRLDGDHGVDLSGHTVCPGFIDCHVHVTLSHVNMWRYLQEPASLAFYQTVRNMGLVLDAGITTARDAAGADLGTKRAVEIGLIRGPRLQIAISLISQTGGHSDGWLPSGCSLTSFAQFPGMPNPIADGTDELRKKVRELIRAGADVIKIATSGGVMSPADDPRHAHYRPEEIRAVVDEAAAAGRYVMAHAQATEGIKNALRAGVRSIEHGVFLDDEAIGLMVDARAFLVPTLIAAESIRAISAEAGSFEAAAGKVDLIMDAQRASFRAALAAGVQIAFGTDAVGYPHGRNLDEIEIMVHEGMAPLEALKSATSVAARLLRINDIGTVGPGCRADLAIVAGDVTDVTGLRGRVRSVWQDGIEVSGTLSATLG